eukprot:scaffold6290_cov125-Isochrysis_galbana.AAC.7
MGLAFPDEPTSKEVGAREAKSRNIRRAPEKQNPVICSPPREAEKAWRATKIARELSRQWELARVRACRESNFLLRLLYLVGALALYHAEKSTDRN